jgi:hypothetical protein
VNVALIGARFYIVCLGTIVLFGGGGARVPWGE